MNIYITIRNRLLVALAGKSAIAINVVLDAKQGLIMDTPNSLVHSCAFQGFKHTPNITVKRSIVR